MKKSNGIDELEQNMFDARDRFQTRQVWERKLGCLAFVLFLIVVFFMFLLSYKVESEQIGYERAKTELIQDVQASEAVPVQPDQVAQVSDMVESSTSQAYSNNSVYNWQFAVDRWNECKNDVSFYQDWVNWYGEESAMQMCIISHSENGSRDPKKTHVNKDLSVDVGLFQINAYWHCGKIGMANGNACVSELQKPDVNLQVARQIYEAQGWTPWYGRKAHLPAFHTDRLTIN